MYYVLCYACAVMQFAFKTGNPMYRSVAHIRPPFCNLSPSRKRRGLLCGIWHLSCEYAPSSGATSRCWHRNMHYRLIEAGSTLIYLHFSRQDRLTEVGHSVDSGVFQSLRGFVLSMCSSIDTTCEHACNHRCSADAGFVLALPLCHRDLDLKYKNKDKLPVRELGLKMLKLANQCSRIA